LKPHSLIIAALLAFTCSNVKAQKHLPSNTNFNKDSEEKTIKDPGLELVISSVLFYTSNEGIFDPATEIHLTYWVNHEWAFGIGYTLIFEDTKRVAHELAVLISHKPWPFLTVNGGPSFTLPNSEEGLEISAYFEGEFNFEIGGFHAGPLIGTLLGKEFRLFTGLHLGYDF